MSKSTDAADINAWHDGWKPEYYIQLRLPLLFLQWSIIFFPSLLCIKVSHSSVGSDVKNQAERGWLSRVCDCFHAHGASLLHCPGLVCVCIVRAYSRLCPVCVILAILMFSCPGLLLSPRSNISTRGPGGWSPSPTVFHHSIPDEQA